METTKLSSIEPSPSGKGPRGWLIAAAAAAFVLIAGIALALLSITGENEPVATTQPPTPTTEAATPTTAAATPTTVAPTTTADPAVEAAALAVVESFASTEDIDTAMALVDEDAEINEYGRSFTGIEAIREWREARLRAWIVEVSDFEANGNTVRFRRLSYWHDTGELAYADTVTVIVEDGLIKSHRAR